MILPIKNLVILGIGVIYFIVFMVIYFKSKKYDNLFENLDEKDFPLKDAFAIGYTVMEIINYRYKSKNDRKTKSQLEIIYGKQYADYYLRVLYAQKVTYSVILVLFAFPLYGLSSDVTYFVLMFLLAFFAYYYVGESTQRKIDVRSNEMIGEFAEAVSKMSILVNAGMVLREAWAEVAYGTDGTLYDEMRIAYEGMRNGESDEEAIIKFGSRCVVPQMKKFSSTVVQAIQKGSGDMTDLLIQQSCEVWNTRKQIVMREGERASGKLMIPMFLMFAGVLIMIVVPLFTNLGI